MAVLHRILRSRNSEHRIKYVSTVTLQERNTCQGVFEGLRLFWVRSRDDYLSQKELGNVRALFVAGHPALDFLNTRMRVNHALVDIFESDGDVLAWLKQAGLPLPPAGTKIEPLSLLRSARKLREHMRLLVERRKAGQRADPSILNHFLAASQSHPRLLWNKPNSPKIDRVRRQDTSESILAPVAESAADLLANGDFELVKRCEDGTCVLWFSDQTKSHHRRWCSMEICGNRNKVAAYRERRRDQAASRG